MAKTSAYRSETADIGLSPETQDQMITELNSILANYMVLSVKVKNYHWNVVGIHFIQLHTFFENIYNALAEDIDEIAERTRMLGGRPLGTMADFVKTASLKEETRTHVDSVEMLRTFLKDLEASIQQLREVTEKADEAEDFGTADFLTGLMEDAEKTAWMTRAMVTSEGHND
jgi:starvation-inducible DNA-binding protein